MTKSPRRAVACAFLLTIAIAAGCASTSGSHSAAIPESPELLALYTADQADRTPGTAPGDWDVVMQNDHARQKRVRELLDSGKVCSASDYFHAAMVYQHADDAEGIQLAHELAMISACMGSRDARWLAAASYDRMLMRLNQPQRFATQYRSGADGKIRLYQVSEGVTDPMRAALNAPTLQEARAREELMQKQLDELAKSMAPAPSGK